MKLLVTTKKHVITNATCTKFLTFIDPAQERHERVCENPLEAHPFPSLESAQAMFERASYNVKSLMEREGLDQISPVSLFAEMDLLDPCPDQEKSAQEDPDISGEELEIIFRIAEIALDDDDARGLVATELKLEPAMIAHLSALLYINLNGMTEVGRDG